MSVLFVILLFLAACIWIALVAGSMTLHSSDPAGNALTHSFTVLALLALWVSLALILLIAGYGGRMLRAQLGRQLRSIYSDTASQPVPERFVKLLEELEAREKRG